MKTIIKTHKLGKLRIYLKAGDNIQPDSIRRKLFPKNAHKSIIDLAKNDGIMNASVYNTHLGYSNFDRIQQYSPDSDNAGLTVCIELIDSREKLEIFFLKHQTLFKDKVVVFKEVEYWDAV